MTRYEQEKSASSNVRRGALDTLTSAPQVGLEPTTLRLTVGCSDQLSYWGMVWNRPRNLAPERLKSTGQPKRRHRRTWCRTLRGARAPTRRRRRDGRLPTVRGAPDSRGLVPVGK